MQFRLFKVFLTKSKKISIENVKPHYSTGNKALKSQSEEIRTPELLLSKHTENSLEIKIHQFICSRN